MTALYDTIGLNYANLRQADPRIAKQIRDALGGVQTVINVGAGIGSYEPTDLEVTSIEPSSKMIAQRAKSSAVSLQGYAEALPFSDNSFDAALAVLTIHHWTDQQKGLSEMRRVSRGPVVILTFDAEFPYFWLADYFPALTGLDKDIMPSMKQLEDWLGPITIEPIPIPEDCSDGFLAGYWKRPAAYLEEKVRKSISPFWMIEGVEEGLNRLEHDLAQGIWQKRYADLLNKDSLDCGYRLIIAK